jgi:hypothetical protein
VVQKHTAFAAPYRSKTFNDTQKLVMGRNGVLSGGEVTTSGGIVTIQPLTFVQAGGIVEVTHTLSASAPSLAPPYFVALSVSNMRQNLGEVITPTFVKSALEVNGATVLVAQWDGSEWIPLPQLDIGQLIKYMHDIVRAQGLRGIADGFDVAKVASDLVVAPGSAFASDGSLVTKNEETTFPIVASDPDGFDRIDRIVLRKPVDDVARPAKIEYVVGQTFHPTLTGTQFTAGAQVATGAGATAPKILELQSGSLAILNLETTSLKLHLTSEPLAPSAAITVDDTVGTQAFDASVNPDGTIDVVRTTFDGEIEFIRLSTVGVVESRAFVVSALLQNITLPEIKIAHLREGGSYVLHVFALHELTSERRIGYVRFSAAGDPITDYSLIVNLSANLSGISVAADDDDNLLFLAFANDDTGRAYLRSYSGATATQFAAPLPAHLPVEVSDGIYSKATSAALGSTTVTAPIVKRTEFKQTFVFMQASDGVTNGIAIYNIGYLNEYGFKTMMPDLGAMVQNGVHAVDIDSHGIAHVAFQTLAGLDKASVDLGTVVPVAQPSVFSNSTSTLGVQVKCTTRSSILLGYSSTSPTQQARVLKATGLSARDTFRDPILPSSDILLAQYRQSDSALYVMSPYGEEYPAVRRLYEYNTLFAGAGSVTWSGSSGNKLTVNSAITLRFLNRRSSYVVDPNGPAGIVVGDNAVCYVQIPDTDAPDTLTLKVADLGSGILDRHNRNVFPLFWCIGGVLYSKFAPFRLNSDGETILIGDTLSTEFLNWVGAPDSNPDPTAHGYSSATIIEQDDSHNEAIGKLDAGVNQAINTMAYGSQAIASGASSVAVTLPAPRALDTYHVVATLENLTDADLMFQTIIITAKATAGFTAAWNVPVDTGNYRLHWTVRDIP